MGKNQDPGSRINIPDPLFTPNPAAIADLLPKVFYKTYLCAGEAFDEAAALPVPQVRLQERKSVRPRLPLPVPHGEPRV